MKNLTWLNRHSEWIILPFSLIIWYVMPYILRWIDPGAGAHDLGMIQVPFLALVITYIGIFSVWLGLRIGMPEVYRTLDNYLLNHNTLTEWQRLKFALSYFAVLLITFAIIVLAVA